MISHPNIKFPTQAALSRGLAMEFSVNAANFADGDPCPAAAGKINTEFFSGLGVAQLRASQLPCAQLPALLSVVPLKHRKTPVTFTQTQDPAPGMADHAGRLEHQLLHHRLDAPALGFVAHRRVGLCQSVLPNQAQQIHRHCGELADQIVGVKLSARQALQIHISLELRVKLLMRGVITVQRNHLGRTERLGQRRRPALQGVLRPQQWVAMLVDTPFSQAVDPAHRIGLTVDAVQRQRFLPRQAPQVHRKRAVTINAGVSAADQLFLGAAVVHRKGIEIDRGVAASQGSKVDGLPVDAAAKQQLIHLRGQLKPRCRMRVHTLAQCRARGNSAQSQRTLEEGVVSKALDRIKVAFTQTQQGEIAFEDLTVGDPRAHGKLRIDQRIDVNALEVFADKRQSGMGAEVVGQFLDNKISHVCAHLLGEQYMWAKSLISMKKSTYFDLQVTDSG